MTETAAAPANGVLTGSLKWFDAAKGYGFIKLDDGKPDVFLHVKELRKSGIIAINDGVMLSFKANDNPKGKGLFATEIKVLPPGTA